MTIKHAIIACHPDENSFVLSMARRHAQTAQSREQQVVLRDLHRLDFDRCYPSWFGSPPAMLKGHVDRVFGASTIDHIPLPPQRDLTLPLSSQPGGGYRRCWARIRR